jgi:sugar phosphate isomerase/epimerase
MDIFISTNIYRANELENVFDLLEEMNDTSIGIELFPEWNNPIFAEVIKKNLSKFQQYTSSLHGPYYETEHSKAKDTIEYEASMNYFKKTLELSKMLNSKYIVFHHNNCIVKESEKNELIINSTNNLLELNKLANDYNTKIVVENCGVISNKNVLFNEKEFIELALKIDNDILIDIGHAYINGWDIEYIINKLKHKITSYHLHNNEGVLDSHNRLNHGNINILDFIKLYYKFTPDADLVLEYSNEYKDELNGIVEDIKTLKKYLLH